MKVYQRLARAFKAEGVSHVFGLMGDGNMYWMHELDKLGVKSLEVRHEGSGLGMADGWARVTRTPGVATATCGPGVSQLATALLTASRGETPLVAFVGEHPTNDDEYNQRLDQSHFAAACETGFGGRGRLVRSIPELRTAVAEWVAKPGPMMIDARIAASVVPLPNRRLHYGLDE